MLKTVLSGGSSLSVGIKEKAESSQGLPFMIEDELNATAIKKQVKARASKHIEWETRRMTFARKQCLRHILIRKEI